MSRSTVRRRVLVSGLVAVAVLAPASHGFAADDGGVGAFFREAFGLADAPQPSVYGLPDEHPIIVRPRRPHVVRRPQAKIAVGPMAPVSIYEDHTLKAGDAVMTKTGVRVFLGGHSMPYTEADFAALSDAEGLPKQVQKALVTIDKAPRG